MKFISKTTAKQVMRAFAVAQLMAQNGNRRYLSRISKESFSKKLKRVKARVKKMDRKKLERAISWPPRREAYKGITSWRIASVSTNEVAVWRGAGGLPVSWTSGSLATTGRRVLLGISKDSNLLKKRIKRAIPGILGTSLNAIQKDPYLFPIILPPGTIPSCRRGLKKYKGDIDDGCMRSIALAARGKKTMKAYVGVGRRGR